MYRYQGQKDNRSATLWMAVAGHPQGAWVKIFVSLIGGLNWAMSFCVLKFLGIGKLHMKIKAMFDKEGCIKTLTTMMGKSWSNEQIEAYAERLAEQHSHIKEGEDVIHLEFNMPFLHDTDMPELESRVSAIGYRLSWFNDSLTMKASAQELVSPVTLFLGGSLIRELAVGAAGNAVWEGVKSVAVIMFQKFNRNANSYATKASIDTNQTLSLKCNFENNCVIEFKIESNNANYLEKMFDKTLAHIKEQNANQLFTGSKVAIYDPIKNEWEIVPYSPFDSLKIKHPKN